MGNPAYYNDSFTFSADELTKKSTTKPPPPSTSIANKRTAALRAAALRLGKSGPEETTAKPDSPTHASSIEKTTTKPTPPPPASKSARTYKMAYRPHKDAYKPDPFPSFTSTAARTLKNRPTMPASRLPVPSYKPAPAYKPAPFYKSLPSYKSNKQPPSNNAHVKYNFGWKVVDDYAELSYGQVEDRDGYLTNGQYHVLLPDCRTQIVKYTTTDGDSGNVAEVTYDGNPCVYDYKLHPTYN